MSNQGCNSPRRAKARSQQDYCQATRTVSWLAKSCLRERMRTTHDSEMGAHLPGLVELLASWLLDFSCAQRLLAGKMITMVAHFPARVVNFIFGGRNSGQNTTKSDKPVIQSLAKATDLFSSSAGSPAFFINRLLFLLLPPQ